MRVRADSIELLGYSTSELSYLAETAVLFAKDRGWSKVSHDEHYFRHNGMTVFSCRIEFSKEVPDGLARENPISYEFLDFRPFVESRSNALHT